MPDTTDPPAQLSWMRCGPLGAKRSEPMPLQGASTSTTSAFQPSRPDPTSRALLRRTFARDLFDCGCGGRRRLVAFVTDRPKVVESCSSRAGATQASEDRVLNVVT